LGKAEQSKAKHKLLSAYPKTSIIEKTHSSTNTNTNTKMPLPLPLPLPSH